MDKSYPIVKTVILFNKMAKLLVVTEWAPPVVEGGPIILGKIFKYFPPGDFCILTADFSYHRSRVDANKPNYLYYLFKPLHIVWLSENRVVNFINNFLLFASIPLIVLKGLNALKRENIQVVLGVSNRGPFLIASYLISCLSGRRYYVYLLDAYQDLLTSRWQKFIAKIFEPKILAAAEKVLVMSETLQELYWQRYKIKSSLVPQPVDLELYFPRKAISLETKKREIVYTGVVYSPQLDGIHNMVKAVNSFGSELKFSIYTPQDNSIFHLPGVEEKNIQIKYVPHSNIAEVQKLASILFLPLSFECNYRNLVATAAPSKLPEYLASGVPILVNAPSYAYVTYFVKKHRCGLVVEENKPNKLIEAIRLLLNDKKIGGYFVDNALRVVRDHDEKKVAKSFINLLGLESQNV